MCCIFSVTWEHKNLALQNTVFPCCGVSESQISGLIPADVLSQFGPTTNPFKEDLFFGKLDFEPTSEDRFELTVSSARKPRSQAPKVSQPPRLAQNYKNNDNRWDLKWQHSADRWVNEAQVSFQNTEFIHGNDQRQSAAQLRLLYRSPIRRWLTS